tara:strand:+ start:1126 stop:1476 length:351 start_codon:yes stop_codon:yes gene_type:complete
MEKLSTETKLRAPEYTNSEYIIDLHSHEENHHNGETPTALLLEELYEYIHAVEEKRKIFQKQGRKDMQNAIGTITRDMEKSVTFFKQENLSFSECYEEIISLYVFTELYLKLERKT